MKTAAKASATAPAAWALTGPTGAGKSALACALAEQVGGEIIGCDSVQLYCGFDVGSAKPSLAQRGRVPHHLVDCYPPDAHVDAHAWCLAARARIAEVRGRGRVPLLVGGTGLYLRALQRGLIAVPSDAKLRAELNARVALDPLAAHAWLAALDPAGASQLHPHNSAHLVRALEICLSTGRPASEVRAEHAAGPATADALALVVVALDGPDAWLRPRLRARSEAMVASGLLEEVRALLASGVARTVPAMRAVGYREALAVLDGALPAAELCGQVAMATWRYVRRQRTWLRREPPSATLDASAYLSGPQPGVGGDDWTGLTEATLAAFHRACAAAPAATPAPSGSGRG